MISLQVNRGTCLSASVNQTISLVGTPTGTIDATGLSCGNEIDGGNATVMFNGNVTPNGGERRPTPGTSTAAS